MSLTFKLLPLKSSYVKHTYIDFCRGYSHYSTHKVMVRTIRVIALWSWVLAERRPQVWHAMANVRQHGQICLMMTHATSTSQSCWMRNQMTSICGNLRVQFLKLSFKSAATHRQCQKQKLEYDRIRRHAFNQDTKSWEPYSSLIKVICNCCPSITYNF